MTLQKFLLMEVDNRRIITRRLCNFVQPYVIDHRKGERSSCMTMECDTYIDALQFSLRYDIGITQQLIHIV